MSRWSAQMCDALGEQGDPKTICRVCGLTRVEDIPKLPPKYCVELIDELGGAVHWIWPPCTGVFVGLLTGH